LVKTGEHTFCIVGEWASFKALAAARPQVGETEHDVREVMVEGISNVLAVHPLDERPQWIPTRRRLPAAAGTADKPEREHDEAHKSEGRCMVNTLRDLPATRERPGVQLVSASSGGAGRGLRSKPSTKTGR